MEEITVSPERDELPATLAEPPGSLAAMSGADGAPALPDVELVKQAATGDHAAFTALFYQTYRYAFVLVAAILPSDGEIRDVLQEVYTRVYTGLPRLREPGAFLGWLKVIAQNCALTQRNKNAIDPLSTAVYLGDVEEKFLAKEEPREEALDIRAVLESLPEEQARLLVLVYYDGLKLADIARMQGLPASTVRSRFAAAKRALQKALKGRGIDRAVYARGGLITAMATSIRDAIGTDMLSAATAQDVLDGVLHTAAPAPMGHVVAKLTKRRRDAAVLRIAALVVMLSLVSAAVTVALMTGRDRLPVAQPAPITTTTTSETAHTTTTAPSEGEIAVPPASATTTATEAEEPAATTPTSTVASTEPTAGTTAKTTGTTASTSSTAFATTTTTTIPTTTTTTVPQPTFVPDYRAGYANVLGNTAVNLLNQGLIAKQDRWVYMATGTEHTLLIKKNLDTGETVRIHSSAHPLSHLNVVGDWIYFVELGIQRIRTDGSGLEYLSFFAPTWMAVRGDTLFYTTSGALYSLDINSQTTHFLYNWIEDVFVCEDRMLYRENSVLYLEKNNRRTLLDDPCWQIYAFDGDYVYYKHTAKAQRSDMKGEGEALGPWALFEDIYWHVGSAGQLAGAKNKGCYILDLSTLQVSPMSFTRTPVDDRTFLFDDTIYWFTTDGIYHMPLDGDDGGRFFP